MAAASDSPESGRHAAIVALTDDAARFPDIAITSTPNTAGLSVADAALALAIHRTVLQRWLTLEYLLNRFLNQPFDRLEPAMRAVLLSGAAQLLFMQRVPAYAVVDQTVALARRLLRPKAGGMVNAVLRRIADGVRAVARDEPWEPAADVLPLDEGTLHLTEPWLPSPEEQFDEHLGLATSHPKWLVHRWLSMFEPQAVQAVCRHGVRTAPTIVAVEAEFEASPADELWEPHETPGFLVWRGEHEALVRFLAEHPHRRVQDPAARRAVEATRGLPVRTILDYCAGRGTKTIQLAAEHPEAEILAADPDPDRAASLRGLEHRFDNITVTTPTEALAARVDLLLLDVPCSNTGVLARRPAARYRLTHRRLKQLAALQQEIVEQSVETLELGGWVLYSTCSIEPEENDQQTRWIEEQTGGEVLREALTLPAGHARTHHDGSYHALVQRGGGG